VVPGGWRGVRDCVRGRETCEASPEAAASMCGSIADPHPHGRGFIAVSYHPCHRRKRPDGARTIMSTSIVIQYLLAWDRIDPAVLRRGGRELTARPLDAWCRSAASTRVRRGVRAAG